MSTTAHAHTVAAPLSSSFKKFTSFVPLPVAIVS